MIPVDAKIFMYALGAMHANKLPAVDYLRRVANGEVDAATGAEVLQDIHRYGTISR